MPEDVIKIRKGVAKVTIHRASHKVIDEEEDDPEKQILFDPEE